MSSNFRLRVDQVWEWLPDQVWEWRRPPPGRVRRPIRWLAEEEVREIASSPLLQDVMLSYLTENVHKVVWQNSLPAQIRQLILYGY